MVDEIDKKILHLLLQNARTPFTKIAEKVGLSEGAVRKRIEAMEKKGIIKRYTIDVEPKKLGYNSITFLGLDVEPTKLLDVAGKLSEIKEVRAVYLSAGDHMIMAEVWARDGEHLSKILTEQIGKIDGVKRLCPAILLEEIKNIKNETI